jgi:hypothetical protein
MLRAQTARSQRPPVLVLGKGTKPKNLSSTLMGSDFSGFKKVELTDTQFDAPTDSSIPVIMGSGGFEQAGMWLAKIIPWLDGNQSSFL